MRDAFFHHLLGFEQQPLEDAGRYQSLLQQSLNSVDLKPKPGDLRMVFHNETCTPNLPSAPETSHLF